MNEGLEQITEYVDESDEVMVKGSAVMTDDRRTLFFTISSLIIIGAFCVAAMISLLSEFGVHPDEWDVRACLDWCKDRFIWPDMRLTGYGLGDTYSGYGYTKVCNYTPYFLIASKIAIVFEKFMDVLPYFRMPNLLLMAGMSVYILKKVRTRNYLMLGFGICVQAWYIFSYVTADAMDFALAFVSIAWLADPHSFLWTTLGIDNPIYDNGDYDRNFVDPGEKDCHAAGNAYKVFDKTHVIRCALAGILYGVILLGKPYYYANLVLTFIVIVSVLIKSEINLRKGVLARCILIAGIAFAILFARFSLDLYYYGFDKAEVKTQMAEAYAHDDKKPSTPAEEQDVTWHMASKGYSVLDLFEYEPRWGEMSFRSFVSARVLSEGDRPYYAAMAVLYSLIYIWIGFNLCRSGQTGILITGTILNLGGIIASVLNSWLIDSQPQGRYLLPILLTTCFMGSRARALWHHRAFRALILVTGILSLGYFALFDSRVLIDLSYARTLLNIQY